MALGAFLAGYPKVAVYDGSFSEWGLHGPLLVATGPEYFFRQLDSSLKSIIVSSFLVSFGSFMVTPFLPIQSIGLLVAISSLFNLEVARSVV